MTTQNSRPSTPKRKRPNASPLFLHRNGQWARKVKLNGKWKFRYFGRDREKALAQWNDERGYLLAGMDPPKKDVNYCSVEYACRAFMAAKQTRLGAGLISQKTFDENEESAEFVMAQLGKDRDVENLGPQDFDKMFAACCDRWGLARRSNVIQRAKSIFKYSFESGYIDRPVRFGSNFKVASKREKRIERRKKPKRFFDAATLRKLIDKSSVQLRGMIYLGINCGFINTDCGELPIEAVNLKAGYLEFPRAKTGVNRKCFLWPETVKALGALNPLRRKAEKRLGRKIPTVFWTKYPNSPIAAGKWTTDAITHEFRKLLNRLKLFREGLSFSTLRHTFQTVGDQSADTLAVKQIMGHVDDSISEVYREWFPDERLKKVAEIVRDWLLAKNVKGQQTK